MLIAMAASSADARIVSECAWCALQPRQLPTCCSATRTHRSTGCCRYFVAFSFDTTLGVALAIGLHSLAVKAARQRADRSGFAACVADCGSYGEAHAL